MKEKTIRILIEIPEKWVDFNSPLGMVSYSVHQTVEKMIKELVEEKYISQIKLPAIDEITTEQVKDRVATILAKRALDKEIN